MRQIWWGNWPWRTGNGTKACVVPRNSTTVDYWQNTRVDSGNAKCSVASLHNRKLNNDIVRILCAVRHMWQNNDEMPRIRIELCGVNNVPLKWLSKKFHSRASSVDWHAVNVASTAPHHECNSLTCYCTLPSECHKESVEVVGANKRLLPSLPIWLTVLPKKTTYRRTMQFRMHPAQKVDVAAKCPRYQEPAIVVPKRVITQSCSLNTVFVAGQTLVRIPVQT